MDYLHKILALTRDFEEFSRELARWRFKGDHYGINGASKSYQNPTTTPAHPLASIALPNRSPKQHTPRISLPAQTGTTPCVMASIAPSLARSPCPDQRSEERRVGKERRSW